MGEATEKKQLMRSFIQDLSLNFHFFLDVFLHGNTSPEWQPFVVSGASKASICTVQSGLLIPKQILLFDIALIKLDNAS